MTTPAAVAESLRGPLDAGLDALGLPLAGEARERLLRFVDLLAKWNGVYNLTAIREPGRMVTHHLLDSLAVVAALDALVAGRDRPDVLDVGSGAGLPGLPLAIARPAWRVTMREPVQKKHAFVTQAIAELGVPNAQASLGRVEDLRAPGGFAIVISRAFADLASFAESSLAHVAHDGRLVAMKGVHPDEELRELPPGVEVERALELHVPGLDAARHLIVMKRRASGAPREGAP
ncbi:MAG TPA: 16S rRNA (guanine(527)-N(7))-methyltransferase RsmG [Casimicrobiaceae bacterium]|nr:16S rRNA (guanine(527)-N(7))-methyltransferase RsmG [Casimicrobiaceae bacterium]